MTKSRQWRLLTSKIYVRVTHRCIRFCVACGNAYLWVADPQVHAAAGRTKKTAQGAAYYPRLDVRFRGDSTNDQSLSSPTNFS